MARVRIIGRCRASHATLLPAPLPCTLPHSSSTSSISASALLLSAAGCPRAWPASPPGKVYSGSPRPRAPPTGTWSACLQEEAARITAPIPRLSPTLSPSQSRSMRRLSLQIGPQIGMKHIGTSPRSTTAFKRPLASSRGGGRKPAQATEATREISVFTVGGRAQWQLTQGYAAKVDVIRAHLGTSVVGGGHPVLGIDTISLADGEYEELVTKVFGHVQHPVKEFRKLLCELGLRASGSTSKTGARTLTFDIDGWNQNGYRLTSQGRRRGPKPSINYISADCVETDKHAQ